jgi:chromosome segregation ATPase
MVPFYARNGAGDLLARYSFIEPLLDGSRVLEVDAAGSTEGATALFLADRGAAAVLSIDAEGDPLEAARRAASHPFVQFRSAALEELPAGAFDLVLVADGGALAADPARVAALRRLVARGGHLVTALAAPDAAGLAEIAGEPPAPPPPGYESFAGALGDHFPVVEVATQSATVGWVVALGSEDEEPDISIDGALAGAPEAAWYVAICGEESSGLSGLTIVALPPRPLVELAAARAQPAAGGVDEAELAGLHAEANRARELETRVRELEAALEAEREASFETRASADRAEAALAQDRHDLDELRAALAERTADLARLKSERDRAEEERARAASELAELRAAQVEHDAGLQGARAEAQAARAAVEAALARAVAAEGRVSELEEAAERQESELRNAAERQAEGEAARRAADAERVRADGLEQELAQARREASDARAELELARRDAEAVRAREAGIQADLAQAEGRAKSAAVRAEETGRLEKELAQLSQATAESGSVREALEAQVAELSARAEALEERARIAEAKAAEANALLENSRVESEGRLREAVARAERVEVELESAHGERQQALAAREEAAAELARVRAEIAEKAEKSEPEAGPEAVDGPAAVDQAAQVERLRAEVEDYARARSRLETEVLAAKNTADAAEAQAAALEAELQAVRWEKEELEQQRARAAQPAGDDPRLHELETKLTEALQKLADAETAAAAARNPGTPEDAKDAAEGLRRAAQDRDSLQAQIADRDARIARLQREVADKTDRLGRLAKEMGELKAKGLGKLFR